MTAIINHSLRGMPRMETTGIPLTLKNPKTQEPNIFIGVESTLEIALVNRTGGIVTIHENATLYLFWPEEWFGLPEITKMTPALEGFKIDDSEDPDPSMLKFIATQERSWKPDETLLGSIGKIMTKASPAVAEVVITFEDFEGDMPMDTRSNLILINPPQEGNARLDTALQVSLDSQGSIIVSGKNDPIRNTLFLNLKNQQEKSLFSGNRRDRQPEVRVRFIYGNTPGSLAPDNDRDQPVEGSAWLIKSAIVASMGNNWVPRDPRPSDTGRPEWVFTPSNDNIPVIGTGDKANITFSFSNIVSFTQPGHTQMIILFSGFYATETQKYDDAAFIMDIVKINPPPTRGILNLFSRNPILKINNPKKTTQVELRWAMFHVAYVDLIVGLESVNPVRREYVQGEPVHFDNQIVNIPSITQNTLIPITLQAYSGSGGFLNSSQFMVFAQVEFFKDPRDGQTYPIQRFGNKIWMTQNLNWNSGEGFVTPNNGSGNTPEMGKLYNFKTAKDRIPAGWRLPTKQDWDELVHSFGERDIAYSKMIAGGESGFDAELSGMADSGKTAKFFKVTGAYWTDTPDSKKPGEFICVRFSANSKKVILGEGENGANFLSVRLVRDLH